MAVRLNGNGWKVGQVAQYLQIHEHTVRSALRQWQTIGLYGLWEKRRLGRQRQWQDVDLETVERWLQEERSYTSRQLCQKLASERHVQREPAHFGAACYKKGVLLEAIALQSAPAKTARICDV